MRSPTAALLWEIWRRNRAAVAVMAAATSAGLLLDYAEQPTGDPSSLIVLLWMVSLLCLFGLVGCTEPTGTRGLGCFPRRLFVLPISSLRLVAVPVLTGIAAVELLYLLWFQPLMRGASLSAPFVAVMLGAFVVVYQAVLWTLERLGPLRLMVAAVIAIVMYGVGLLPSWPPAPPPPWRSEGAVGSVVAALAVAVFLVAWTHVARARCGGGRTADRRDPLIARAAGVLPSARTPFRSPAAAQFWFEWRCSGLALPMLAGGVLIAVVTPLSWYARDDAAGSLHLLLGTLAAPVILAIPVGMAFSRPTFWSEDLSLPAFVAIRPLSDEQIVAIKMKVAAASVAVAWLLVLCFDGAWLSLWANLDAVSRLAIQWWAFHERSLLSVYQTAALLLISGMVLTWRFLVTRLWTGLSGSRPRFMTSVMSVIAVTVAGFVFAADRLPGWVLDDPARMGGVVWMLSIAVIVRGWLAAHSWSGVSRRYTGKYVLVWSIATGCLVAFALDLWQVVRIYVALDIYRCQAVAVLLALLSVPLARIGFAPSALARNRHR